jgi:hypothetical protein
MCTMGKLVKRNVRRGEILNTWTLQKQCDKQTERRMTMPKHRTKKQPIYTNKTTQWAVSPFDPDLEAEFKIECLRERKEFVVVVNDMIAEFWEDPEPDIIGKAAMMGFKYEGERGVVISSIKITVKNKFIELARKCFGMPHYILLADMFANHIEKRRCTTSTSSTSQTKSD